MDLQQIRLDKFDWTLVSAGVNAFKYWLKNISFHFINASKIVKRSARKIEFIFKFYFVQMDTRSPDRVGIVGRISAITRKGLSIETTNGNSYKVFFISNRSQKIQNSDVLLKAVKIAISDPVYEAKVGDIVNFTASQIDEDVVIAINVSIYK